MKAEYDFSEARPNPYLAKLRKPVTIRLDVQSVAYFRQLAIETGIPYQSLINLFLADCVAKRRRPDLGWS
ncbi:MAG TPA: CopG family antitoxin [Spirochaetales bacterium]|nr:CopG family antitoxin [Spirochaetales bacterium]